MAESTNFIVATRGSLLARTQTEQTVELIRKLNPEHTFEIIQISTLGDNVTDKPLVSFGGTGVFVKELETALLNNKADFAVHSLKDVPGKLPQGLILASFPKREIVNDLFLTNDGKDMASQPQGFKIGTGSPRRIVQMKKIRPDAVFADLRGNIDTRLRKLSEGLYDAIILAAAGVRRLGKTIPEGSVIPVDLLLPAVGQGAIAIECREGDQRTIAVVKKINHPETETAITTERIFMQTIEGGCKFPLAAYSTVSCNQVKLDVMAGEIKTGRFIRKSASCPVEISGSMAKQLAEQLLDECEQEDIKLYVNG